MLVSKAVKLSTWQRTRPLAAFKGQRLHMKSRLHWPGKLQEAVANACTSGKVPYLWIVSFAQMNRGRMLEVLAGQAVMESAESADGGKDSDL